MDKQLIGHLINRYEAAYFTFNRVLNELLRERLPDGITTEQMEVLRYCLFRQPCRSTELSDVLCISKSSVTAVVNRLVEKRLIERTTDPGDRRVILLTLTEEGVRLAREMADMIEGLFSGYLETIDAGEAVKFVETYESLVAELVSIRSKNR